MAQAALTYTTLCRLPAADIQEIRKHLRERFENQAHRSRDMGSMTDCWRMAETTDDIEADLIQAYASVFEDLREVRLQRALMASVGVRWSPKTASEWIREFIGMATNGGND